MMFLKRAGTTIFSMMVLIWFLASFPRPPEGATGPAIDYSLAAIIGKSLEPLLAPVGFNWQIAVALIPGMAAREVAVASLGTVYAIEGGKEAAEQIGQALATKWSLATALALLAWYIFAPQCASTLAVIRRETGSWRGCWSPSATCWRWPMPRALRPTISRWRSAPAEFHIRDPASGPWSPCAETAKFINRRIDPDNAHGGCNGHRQANRFAPPVHFGSSPCPRSSLWIPFPSPPLTAALYSTD